MPGELSGRRAQCHVAFIPLPSSYSSAAFVSLLPQQHCREADWSSSAPAAPPKLCCCPPSQPCPWARSSQTDGSQWRASAKGAPGISYHRLSHPRHCFNAPASVLHLLTGGRRSGPVPRFPASKAPRMKLLACGSVRGLHAGRLWPQQPRVWQGVPRVKPSTVRVPC
jgi:hypothetical protein